MGIFKGRFTAQSEEGKNTKTGFGVGNSATNSGPNDNAITRHCPIAYYKNDAIVLVTAGVSVQNIVEGSRNAGLWLTVLTSTTDFDNYGLSRNGVSPVLDATDLPDRFAIKIYDVDGGGELTTLRHNYKAAVDLGTSIQANGNPLIISMDAQASSVQGVNMVFDESNASIFMPLEGNTYEVHISGDFDRAEPLDWRALMRDWVDYSADLTGGNSMIADQRIGQLYPELRSAHAAAWAAAQFTDFDDFYADVSANKGAIAGGVVGWDQASAAYYTRVYRVLNENGSTQSEDGGFTSLGGLSHGWGLYASAVGMSSEQFIYVNSNLLTARDIDFRDGKSEWTAYNDISDIPGGDLVANALVYVVAGTIIEGNVLLQDTVFAVNNGQVEVGVGGAGGPSDAVIVDVGNLELSLPAGVYSLDASDATVQLWVAGFIATELGQSDPVVTNNLPLVLAASAAPTLVRYESIDSNGNIAVLTRALSISNTAVDGVNSGVQGGVYRPSGGVWVADVA